MKQPNQNHITEQEGLKCNGSHQLLVDTDNVNILGGSTHAIKKNKETLLLVRR